VSQWIRTASNIALQWVCSWQLCVLWL